MNFRGSGCKMTYLLMLDHICFLTPSEFVFCSFTKYFNIILSLRFKLINNFKWNFMIKLKCCRLQCVIFLLLKMQQMLLLRQCCLVYRYTSSGGYFFIFYNFYFGLPHWILSLLHACLGIKNGVVRRGSSEGYQ